MNEELPAGTTRLIVYEKDDLWHWRIERWSTYRSSWQKLQEGDKGYWFQGSAERAGNKKYKAYLESLKPPKEPTIHVVRVHKPNDNK